MANQRLQMLHIGRAAPKGFREVGGAVHLGRGLWLMKIEAKDTDMHNSVVSAKSVLRKLNRLSGSK